jgi:hypothetical protein
MKIHYQKLSTTCLANGQRQTTMLHYGISTMQEMKPRMAPQKTSQLLVALEHVMKPKTLQVEDVDDGDEKNFCTDTTII